MYSGSTLGSTRGTTLGTTPRHPMNRRGFLRSTGTLASAAMAVSLPGQWYAPHFGDYGLPDELDAPPDWESIQRAFNVDRSLTNLNNGGVCPSPIVVQHAEAAHRSESNRRPFYAHQGEIAPQIERIRSDLADLLGADSEAVALTRNTSEAMEIVQLGLPLQPGDEIVTTNHDYPRMLNTWRQRAAREGIVIKTVDVPVPLANPAELVSAIAAEFTDRTRLVMCCHIVDLTGQVLPVRAISDAAHARDIPVLVDGAQSFGQFPFRVSDLGCDYFATSLHKWLMGPQGTGLLYIKRNRIADVWPLMPSSGDAPEDIRKFEDIGTHPPAPILALGEAISFHRSLGAEQKADRLSALRNYWMDQLVPNDRVMVRTHTPSAYALATIDVDGIDPVDLRNHLWQAHRIRVRPIKQSGVSGIRVSPGIYTTTNELDRFVEIMAAIIHSGIPS